MAYRSRFFDSSSGDRVYSADAWAHVFGDGIVTTGVVRDLDDGLVVTEANPIDMEVLVQLGVAWVDGRFFQVYSSAETVALATADDTYPRKDRIAVRVDYEARTATVVALTGTPATDPVAPNLEDSSSRKEIGLAVVTVPAGATSVDNTDITDTRSDDTVCGWVEHILNDDHDHDSLYAALGHDHDTDYEPLGHDHDTEYSDINHNHDTEYADIDHNHGVIRPATGSYTGNDTDGRIISVGFEPSHVTILQDAGDDRGWVLVGTGIDAIRIGVGSRAAGVYITTDGFRLDGGGVGSPNTNGAVYYYVAHSPSA